MKRFISHLAVWAAMLAITAVASSVLTWNFNPPEENVQKYILEHRPVGGSNWVRVEVVGTTNRVTIPESAFGRIFRISATNDFGQGPWSPERQLPTAIAGFKFVLEITP